MYSDLFIGHAEYEIASPIFKRVTTCFGMFTVHVDVKDMHKFIDINCSLLLWQLIQKHRVKMQGHN